MEHGRAPKRTRQACLNCRRKKTRCSGEMPTCAFCARLNQPCEWDSEQDRAPMPNAASLNMPDSALATRVALLESRLSMLDSAALYRVPEALSNEGFFNAGVGVDSNNIDNASPRSPERGPFVILPARAVLTELIDTYFLHCHNQPYAYFQEPAFRQRFEEDTLPVSLLYAVVATACRFTENSLYHGRQSDAIARYASASWTHIFQQSFSYEDNLDMSLVQAVSMLAVIDFTSGHPRHGWVKLALSVRFAQALRLNEEPDDLLPEWEKEERRRTFWSLYLLDQLISIGPNRPPTFSEIDCTVHLPGTSESFISGIDAPSMPTLEAIIDDPVASRYQDLDYFALTSIMACALGRFIRYSLKRSMAPKHAPWDSRSMYYTIQSMLLQFESHSLLTYSSLSDVLQIEFAFRSKASKERVCHLVFSQALFHLNNCLINHPFIQYHLFQQSAAPGPPSFAKEALERCRNHADKLLALIQEAQACGGLVETSFFGYCALVCGVIFRLFERHHESSVASMSAGKITIALDYLTRQPIRWPFHPHMATVLQEFAPSEDTVRSLTDPLMLAQKRKITDSDFMWSLIDYASLQSSGEQRNSPAAARPVKPLMTDISVLKPAVAAMNSDLNTASASGSSFYETFGEQYTDGKDYLGEDMGGLWAHVFADQSLMSST